MHPEGGDLPHALASQRGFTTHTLNPEGGDLPHAPASQRGFTTHTRRGYTTRTGKPAGKYHTHLASVAYRRVGGDLLITVVPMP